MSLALSHTVPARTWSQPQTAARAVLLLGSVGLLTCVVLQAEGDSSTFPHVVPATHIQNNPGSEVNTGHGVRQPHGKEPAGVSCKEQAG